MASFDDWEQTTLKEANPKWNDPDTFFERMEVKKETKDQKKGGKKWFQIEELSGSKVLGFSQTLVLFYGNILSLLFYI